MATRFGLLLPHFGERADQDLLVEGARLAEQLGFDSLWVRDHLVFHPHGMEGTDRTFIEPFVTLSFVAGVTRGIGLGVATIIPFRHPINLAAAVASLSWITRRPFDLGIGAGNFQHEFDVIGQGDVDRPQLMREQALIARRLWSGEDVAHQSELYAFDDVDLKPSPLTPLPVWWGGATPASARLAVDFCDGWLPGRITFPTYEARVAKIRELTEAQGKPMIKTGALPVTSIGATTAEGLDRVNVPGLLEEREQPAVLGQARVGRVHARRGARRIDPGRLAGRRRARHRALPGDRLRPAHLRLPDALRRLDRPDDDPRRGGPAPSGLADRGLAGRGRLRTRSARCRLGGPDGHQREADRPDQHRPGHAKHCRQRPSQQGAEWNAALEHRRVQPHYATANLIGRRDLNGDERVLDDRDLGEAEERGEHI